MVDEHRTGVQKFVRYYLKFKIFFPLLIILNGKLKTTATVLKLNIFIFISYSELTDTVANKFLFIYTIFLLYD